MEEQNNLLWEARDDNQFGRNYKWIVITKVREHIQFYPEVNKIFIYVSSIPTDNIFQQFLTYHVLLQKLWVTIIAFDIFDTIY